METNAHVQRPAHSASCPVERVTGLIGGKWKSVILHQLFDNGTLRFSELKRIIEGITQKMLTAQLRELEKDGLITRTVYPEVPPRVEYSLSELGHSLKPIIEDMKAWGDAHLNSSHNN